MGFVHAIRIQQVLVRLDVDEALEVVDEGILRKIFRNRHPKPLAMFEVARILTGARGGYQPRCAPDRVISRGLLVIIT